MWALGVWEDDCDDMGSVTGLGTRHLESLDHTHTHMAALVVVGAFSKAECE